MSFLWDAYRSKADDESSSDGVDETATARQSEDFVASEVPSPVMTPSTNNQVFRSPAHSTTPLSWNEAHRMACLRHYSLTVTVEQVEAGYKIDQLVPHPDENTIYWNDEDEQTISNVLLSLIDTSSDKKTSQKNYQSTSVPGRLASYLYRLAASSIQPQPSQNDSDDEEAIDSPTIVDPTATILHAQLMKEVLEYLKRILKSSTSDIVALSSWKDWIENQPPSEVQSFTSLLPSDQIKFLLKGLNRAGVAVDLHNHSNDWLVVVGKGEDIRVRLTKYEQDHAARQIEQQLDSIRLKCEKQLRVVRDIRRRKGNAIPAFKLYKLYEKEKSNKENLWLKVEECRLALQNAVDNESVARSIASTTNVLRDLNKQNEHVYDVLDDFKEELEQSREVEAALKSTAGGVGFDDDELLEELQSLYLGGSNGEGGKNVEATGKDDHCEHSESSLAPTTKTLEEAVAAM